MATRSEAMKGNQNAAGPRKKTTNIKAAEVGSTLGKHFGRFAHAVGGGTTISKPRPKEAYEKAGSQLGANQAYRLSAAIQRANASAKNKVNRVIKKVGNKLAGKK